MLLSQCFGFACADDFHTSFHRIYTSMALRDDMAQGESYFMAEIKAMRRILEAAGKTGAPIACFVDEVLRGTNTVERIAASTQILKYMRKNGILCFAATHDIELTSLLEDEYLDYSKNMIAKAKEKGVKLLLPTDTVAAKEFSNDVPNHVVKVDAIPDDEMGLDIGPETIKIVDLHRTGTAEMQ